MSLLDVLRLCRARLRARTIRAQEGFAVLGIAVGVALLFASQIAGASLSHSVGQLTRQVVGRTQFELAARGPTGLDERLLRAVRRLPVTLALPLVEGPGMVIGPGGSRSIELLGANPHQAQLAGTLVRATVQQLSHAEAVVLPAPLAAAVGVEALEPIHLQFGGRMLPALVGATVGPREIGGLASSPIVFAPLAYAQRMMQMQGRLSRIFVAARPGRQAAVRKGLASLAAAHHLNLDPADWESTLFSVASAPQTQSETLFSGVSALVGFLLAMNAILITVPSRRRLIEDLRLAGATRGKTLEIMLVDAAVIGLLACVLGLVLGDVLSRTLFGANPGYLSFAFPVGDARIITWQSVLLSIAAGMLAAFAGVLWPLRDILAPRERQPRERSPRRLLGLRLGAGLLCVVLALVILLVRPASAILGAAALIVALLLLLSPMYELAIAAFVATQRRFGGAASALAILELRNPSTRVRSLAIAATAAVAVFGALALGGVQSNLQQGLDRSAREIDSIAQIWVTPGGQNNAFATTPMLAAKSTAAALRRVPGIASVGAYRGSFLNWGRRRLWVLAPPNAPEKRLLLASQLLSGGRAEAANQVSHNGGVLLSKALAEEHHLHVGDTFLLPSPQPILVRLSGLITNLGWPSGAIVMSAITYARSWGSGAPSAYVIDAQPGASLKRLRDEIANATASTPGLAVEIASQRLRRHEALARQGLSRLTQIQVLTMIAAVLAIMGALGALLWQRRDRVAYLRVIGYRRLTLWRSLLAESVLLLGAGCAIGAAFGVAAQLLGSHSLATVTGFPIVFDIEAVALLDCVLIGGIASMVAAGIGYPVVSVSPSAVSPAY